MQANEASTGVIVIGTRPAGLSAIVQLGLARLKAACRRVLPDKVLRFQYTTFSSELQRLLRVA